MTEINKPTERPEEQREPITIETAKVIQGMSLVFCGALTMLEALHPHVSLAPSAVLDLVTGNTSGLEAAAAERREKEARKVGKTQETHEVKEEAVDEPETTEAGAVDHAPDDVPASVDGASAAKVKPNAAETPTNTLTQDDITKVIVQKLRQSRGNNEKIGAILKAHGVSKVSELPPAKYEAFLTDLSAI